MNETDYNARLYEKMKAEQDKYRDWILHQEPSEILNHTYECSKLSSIAQSLKPYKTSIKDECEDVASDVKDYIAGISKADNFRFPTDITSTIASLVAQFL